MIISINYDKYKVIEGRQYCYNCSFDQYECGSSQFDAFCCITHKLKKL